MWLPAGNWAQNSTGQMKYGCKQQLREGRILMSPAAMKFADRRRSYSPTATLGIQSVWESRPRSDPTCHRRSFSLFLYFFLGSEIVSNQPLLCRLRGPPLVFLGCSLPSWDDTLLRLGRLGDGFGLYALYLIHVVALARRYFPHSSNPRWTKKPRMELDF